MAVDPERYAYERETPPGMVLVGYWCHRCTHFLDPGDEISNCWGTGRAHPVYATANERSDELAMMREQIATLEYLHESLDDLREARRQRLDSGY